MDIEGQAAIDAAAAVHGQARILMHIAGIGAARRVIGRDGSPAPLEDFARVVNVNLVGSHNVAACSPPPAPGSNRCKTASAA
ncbi:MAG: short-chain dehydrogenase/reductase [Polaromonas sp.]|nr:short-chain dehydrogenase/reductase [Polaromonas sp.]